MKPIEYQCRICGQKGTAECDDNYDAVGDPQKLKRLICHDACYDDWSRRKGIEEHIWKVCVNLVQGGLSEKAKAEEKARGMLRRLTQRYGRWMADHNHHDQIIWEEEIVSLLFEHPENWQQILRNYRRHCEILWQQHENKQQPAALI